MDIPNVFINSRINNKKYMAIIKIMGFLVDILLEISPYKYVPYVITDYKGVKKINFQCQNKFIGTNTASLLYYKNF